MQIEPFIYALFGLVIGSFLNVCIYRIPLGKSVVFPGSACPGCGAAIRPYDNIPLFSYLLLRGKCRACGKSISIQYPFVELMTGIAFFACALKWNFAPPTFVNTVLLSVIIILIFTDLHHRILPNVLTLPGTIVGILLSPLQSLSYYSFDPLARRLAPVFWPGNPDALLPWIGSVLGAILGGGLLLLFGMGYEKLRKRQGLGMGDVKMMAMVGAFLGWPLAILTVMAGSIFGTVIGIFLMIFRHSNLQTKLAFGVFLGVGAAISLFYGLPFLSWYLRIPQ
jgi:leader peptidase (prepilin peptidase) / N-methyltransferase